MRKVHNRIDNLVLFKGVNHSFRVINIKIVKVNLDARQIEVDETAVRRIKYIDEQNIQPTIDHAINRARQILEEKK